jgi:hypothetical protein
MNWRIKKLDAATSYYLRKYYPHVIKWWLVEYNPEAKRIWPSKVEEEEALRLEVLSLPDKNGGEENPMECNSMDDYPVDESAYNATTGSYSGLYGQRPVDESTQQALDSIMSMSAQSNQLNIDSILASTNSEPIVMSEEQEAVIAEANEIYERLMREAAEDEAKKIEAIKAACGQTS